MNRLMSRRGQSIAEYAILFAVVLGAYVAIQTYTSRGLQARVAAGTNAYTGVTSTITSPGDPTLKAEFDKLSQYENYAAETFGRSYQESVQQEHMGAGQVKEEKVSDVSARAVGASQKQKGAKGRTAADALWPKE